ncbi:MAG: GTP-binding protein [Proteobacteria bacterium]|nr:GTP-binding protein [Pseudomonadota bacterium]
MYSKLQSLLPPSTLDDPAGVAEELLSAVLVRSNFIPGVRHRLGWRGVASCPSDPACRTARVAGRDGVFGLGPAPSAVAGRALWQLFYFPHPDEDLADAFSVQAGALVQAEDYLQRVRDFPAHPEFTALFSVGVVDLTCDPRTPSVSIAFTAPERHVIRALDGVTVQTLQGPAELVRPGQADQDLPSFQAAMPLFRTLAASSAYCLGCAPDRLAHFRASLPRYVYDAHGDFGTERWKQGAELRLALGFGAAAEALAPGIGFAQGKTVLTWKAPETLPEEYENEPWWTPNIQGAAHSLDKAAMGIAEPPRLIVLTGFLGAGKTSFLSRFIEQQAARNAFTAVIQNEIGQKGLDGKLLGQRYAVTEMDEGCVCCSLAGNLRLALGDILKTFQPDFVVLETTGLANPANILDEITDLGGQVAFGSVTTLVDAPRALETLDSFEVARSQVRLADAILLNKTDLADEGTLTKVQDRLRQLNPVAPIHRCEHGDLPSALLYGVNQCPVRGVRLHSLDNHATHAGDQITSVLIDAGCPSSHQEFLAWIDALPESVLRAKGLLEFADVPGTQVVQYVPGRLDISPAGEADSGDRFLVLIGRDMDEAVATAPLGQTGPEKVPAGARP